MGGNEGVLYLEVPLYDAIQLIICITISLEGETRGTKTCKKFCNITLVDAIVYLCMCDCRQQGDERYYHKQGTLCQGHLQIHEGSSSLVLTIELSGNTELFMQVVLGSKDTIIVSMYCYNLVCRQSHAIMGEPNSCASLNRKCKIIAELAKI